MKTIENSLRVLRKDGRGSEPYFNGRGELNAGSTREAVALLGRLLREVASGTAHFDTPEQVDRAAARKELLADLASAWRDRSSTAWQDIGNAIALEVTEALTREGLLRTVLAPGDLAQGEKPRIRVRTKNVLAVVSTSVGAVKTQYVRDRYLEPAEMVVSASPRVTEIDIHQGSADLLEDVFLRSQEAVMVGEDRAWYNAMLSLIGVANDQTAMTGGMTPANLASLRQNVARWNLGPEICLIGGEVGSSLLSNSSGFSDVFDPVTQYELIRTGRLGTLFGMRVITDGFRDPNQTVLGSKDVIVLSSPVNHGGYTERNGGVVSNPVDESVNGVPARGWFVYSVISLAIANPRSFAYGLVS